ncbi:PAS domain-containing sensor histidine kinase [Marivita hallyeonensis]|uniref:histidine kinase n=1 Tax=Marivita hallyeonensis TaxID=996342 RepID=A0A1M5MRC4_9RHOB|nr:PAS domain-containing sensor histidine kinase [Marivita hallyeonensis]SHG79612.1 PAS domain S-box-containing protein [Marivita hallyeonensis]
MKQVLEKQVKARAGFAVALSVLSAAAIAYGAVHYLSPGPQHDPVMVLISLILLAAALSASVVNAVWFKKASKRLRTPSPNHHAYHDALDEHAMVCVADRDGRITSINTTFANTLGFTPDDLIGRKHSDLVQGSRAAEAYEGALNDASSGEVWSGTQELSSKSGSRIRVLTTVMPRISKDGGRDGAIFVHTDVSAAMASGAEIGRNAVVDALRDGIVVYDAHTFKLIYANDAFLRRTGWSADDPAEQSLTNMFIETELKTFQRYLDPLLKREVSHVLFEFEHDSGPVEVLTHAVEEIDGARSLVSVVRDITERKRDEHLKLSSVSTVSHELRTPLTSIKGALRLIESGAMGSLNPEVSKLINVAHRNSDRLLAIVNDILTLEKLHSGDLMISPEDVDLRALLNDAAESNAPFAAECHVRFVVETMPEPALVRADPHRLMQVMSNLLSNAAKFSPEGAGVVLRISDRGSCWRVSVEDDGPGIPDHAHETLFDSFIQIDSPKNKSIPSTGLGLTICREIVQRHGGRIAFETEEGCGSTFYFELEKASLTKPRSMTTAVA